VFRLLLLRYLENSGMGFRGLCGMGPFLGMCGMGYGVWGMWHGVGSRGVCDMVWYYYVCIYNSQSTYPDLPRLAEPSCQ
jgi:hypothetical protein